MSNEPPDSVTLVVLHGADLPPGRERFEGVPGVGPVRYATADVLADALPGAHALFVWDLFSEAVTAAWSKADALRWVHAATAGVDNLMFPALVGSDVVVTNSRGVFDEPIAEYVLGAVLAFAKDLPTTLDLQRRRVWRHRETERVGGRHALVVGTGPIGRAIARRLAAVGMSVEGAGRTARRADPDFGTVVAAERLPTGPATAEPAADSFAAALGRADYVVLAAPLTDDTRGLADAALLARMRPTARLVNVGRGQLVVERDLVAALRAGRLAGAALDVFETEPLAEDSPLWELPGVLVSPHMSGDVVGWRDELVELFADNLRRFADGRELRNVVDKRRGYVSGS
ncbi:D-2-hydroxyacid dehydrogenase [Marinitenerispora sediminis]|uniref:Hydroxyacid dehydrogenase n=1 Tax=Marinitenerispora sediminis TaxID=1931232 RepID=A0A368T1H1_9ACTN|nr:D-2-hydroxyacid dehydrogenase [Marinitenerispora sediminis]RCV54005.1 hydroxyacid dehydrogenase [Marinitenerispora sediminis]RCV57781.1 hydroxyacid dehydrogenase [Marinitenerispora sediminis]RCV59526.1 hydroxyacid dehydrogenase [Marinitenerispora sediminis]